jgi:hypothetical protein
MVLPFSWKRCLLDQKNMENYTNAEHICRNFVECVPFLIVGYDFWCNKAWRSAFSENDNWLILIGC